MSRPVSGPTYSGVQIIQNPRVILSSMGSTVYDTVSGDVISLDLAKGGAA